MIRFMLDTDTCVDLLRRGTPRAGARLRRLGLDAMSISSVTLAELRYGVARSARPGHNGPLVLLFAAALEVLPFDDRAAEAYGTVRTELESRGAPIGPLDTLIAAHAVARGLALVTRNTREFRRVPGLELVDWSRR